MLTALFGVYDQFLSLFPAGWHGPVSLLIALLLVMVIWQVIVRNGLWLFLLIVLLPALIPPLRGIVLGIIEFFKFLLGHAGL